MKKTTIIIAFLTILNACSSLPNKNLSEIKFNRATSQHDGCYKKVIKSFEFNGEQLSPQKHTEVQRILDKLPPENSKVHSICLEGKTILPFAYAELEPLGSGYIGRKYGSDTWEMVKVSNKKATIIPTKYKAISQSDYRTYDNNFFWAYETNQCAVAMKENDNRKTCNVDLLGANVEVLKSLKNIVITRKFGLVSYLNDDKLTSHFIDTNTGEPQTLAVPVDYNLQLRYEGIPLLNGEFWLLTNLGKKMPSPPNATGYKKVKYESRKLPWRMSRENIYKVRYALPDGSTRWGFYHPDAVNEKHRSIPARYTKLSQCEEWICGQLPNKSWEVIESDNAPYPGSAYNPPNKVYIYAKGKTKNQAVTNAHIKLKQIHAVLAQKRKASLAKSDADAAWLKQHYKNKAAKAKQEATTVAIKQKRHSNWKARRALQSRCHDLRMNARGASIQIINSVISECSSVLSSEIVTDLRKQVGSTSSYSASGSSKGYQKSNTSSKHQRAMKQHQQNMNQHKSDMKALRRYSKPPNQ